MTAPLKLRNHFSSDATFDFNCASVVEHPWCIYCLLNIKAEINQIGDDMSLTPGLIVTSNNTKDMTNALIVADEGRNDRVQWTLQRSQFIRVTLGQHEPVPPILKHNASRWRDKSAAKIMKY